MEDVIEQLLGREIFEKDDVAVDMRELAQDPATEADPPGPVVERASVLPRRSHPTPDAMLLAFWVDNLSPFLGPHWGNIGLRYYGLSPTCWPS